MVRKKWLTREALAEERDARRTERIAVLVPDARIPKLNENQTAILAEIAAAGGRMRVARSARVRSTARTRRSRLDAGDAGQARPGRDRRGARGLSSRRHSRRRQEVRARTRAERGADGSALVHRGRDDAGRISTNASLRHHQLGQDHRLLRRHAARAGRGQVRASAGPGDWPHARDGGSDVRRLWIAGRAAALRPYAGRARRAVAPHPPRRGPHRRRHALRCLCADGQPRPHPRRRGAGRQLQAGGDAALPRTRRRGDARQVQQGRRRARLGHALAGKLGQ